MKSITLLSLLLLSSIFINSSNGSIWPIKYTTQQVIDSPGSYQLAENTWGNKAPGYGRSYVQVNATLSVDNPDQVDLIQNQASIDIIILKNSESNNLGVDVSSSAVLCCTQPLLQEGKCSVLGSAIVKHANYTTNEYDTYTDVVGIYQNIESHHIIITEISSLSPKINIPLLFNVTEKGLYNVLAISCFNLVVPSHSTKVNIQGDIIFMNPFGYLSGNLYPLLYSNLIVSLLYVLLGVAWLVYCYRFKSTLLQIHYWIALSILLGYLESIIEYASLSQWNKTGDFSVTFLVFTTIFGTLKRAFGRSLVLLVAMGYSIVVPTISRKNKIIVALLTTLYFITRSVQYFIETHPTPSNAAQISYIFLTLPVALFDSCFYWLIFLSLMSTIKLLKNSNQSIKLAMYKKFLYILVYYAFNVVILIIIQMMIEWTSSVDTISTSTWVLNIFWDFSYFTILLAICKIWRPSENNQKYAYSEVNLNDDDIVIHSIGGDDENENGHEEDDGQIHSFDGNDNTHHHHLSVEDRNKTEMVNSFFKL